jgi:hypothetical protein
MSKLHPKIIEIIAKHKGSKITAIHRDIEGINLKQGELITSTSDSISIKEADGNQSTIPFYKGNDLNTLHIYNSNMIDLVRAKMVDHMAEKMKVRANQKIIIANLKPTIHKVMNFVFKQGGTLNMAKGEFDNMGIQDIKLKLAPFYNKELVLPYYQVYHIYLNENTDLIDLT